MAVTPVNPSSPSPPPPLRAEHGPVARSVDVLLDRVEISLSEWRPAADALLAAAAAGMAAPSPDAQYPALHHAIAQIQRLAGRLPLDADAHDLESAPERQVDGCKVVAMHVNHVIAALGDAHVKAHDANLLDERAPAEVQRCADALVQVLERAAAHLAVLRIWRAARDGRTGERIVISAELARWSLSSTTQADAGSWLAAAKPSFARERRTRDGRSAWQAEDVAMVVDVGQDSIYVTSRGATRLLYATASLWGLVAGFAVLVGVFALLDAADLTTRPKIWLAKGATLYLFVILGALAHVASKSLSTIRFDDPIRVYATAGWVDWLALRWVGLLKLGIPITVVTGSLWAAGNVPNAFQDISVALLSGYSADSLFRTSLQRISGASATAAETPAAAGAPPAKVAPAPIG